MSERDLRIIAAAAARVPSGGTIVEIGAFLGRTSYAISKAAKPGVVVYVVDWWGWLPDDYGPDRPGGPIDPRADAEGLFVEYTAGCRNIVRIKGLSPEAHPPLRERGFDFVFIDGDHLSPGFDRDVEFYFSNLAADGILMGDDYISDWPDLVRFLGTFSERTCCTVERRGDKLWEIHLASW
jgi:predicted O-methyltransferase YrrM